MKNELTIFISGKENELDDERAIANELAESLKFYVKSSERRTASSEPMRTENEIEVLNSDIYLGIFGQIYSEPSIAEFDKARVNYIPTLIFVKKLKEGDSRHEKLNEFLQSIKNSTIGVVISEYGNAVDLRNEILKSLSVLLSRRFTETIELRREINNLKSKYESSASLSDVSKKLEFLWGVRYDNNFGRSRIVKFDIPNNLTHGKKYKTFAKIHGHTKNGFLDLALIDPDDKPPYSWFPDPNSYDKIHDTGKLQIGSREYESEWEFSIGNKIGKYKAIMGLFENNYANRVCVDYEIKKISVEWILMDSPLQNLYDHSMFSLTKWGDTIFTLYQWIR